MSGMPFASVVGACLAVTMLSSIERAAAAPEKASVVIGQRDSIRSEVLREDRDFSVYLPPSYRGHGGYTRYPVLYLLDGENFFDTFAGVVRYMGSGVNANTRFPEMIVVAIHSTDRNRDFTPTRSLLNPFGSEQPGYATTGGLPNFLRFMANELIPRIDAEYRTTDYRLFVGHSLAGLAVVQTLLMRPETFDAYLAFDPALWWDDLITLRTARTQARTLDLRKKQLFIATASAQDVKLYAKIDLHAPELIDAIRANRSAGLFVHTKHYDDEDHGSVPLIAFMDGVAKVFEGHKIDHVAYYDHPERIEAQYKALSDRLGTVLHPTENIMNDYGYWFMTQPGLKDMRKALIYFEMNARNYPQSFNAWDSLGEAVLAQGDERRAAQCYCRSLQLNPGNGGAKKILAKLGAQCRGEP